jgi:quercetin dioxygenase-like cupin family protein
MLQLGGGTVKVMSFFEEISGGSISEGTILTSTGQIPWQEHASFKGVYMKHLLVGNQTEGKMSCHLVRIDPGCEIGLHKHDGKVEVHTVLQGDGLCILPEAAVEPIEYMCGKVSVVHSDIPHRVVARDGGLMILAKFSPALL